MDRCTRCGTHFEIPNNGYLTLFIQDNDTLNVLKQYTPLHKDNKLLFSYKNHGELINKINSIQEIVAQKTTPIQVGVSKSKEGFSFQASSLSEFKARIENYDLIQFIQTGELTSIFQPIINLKNNELYAYEHLLRPNSTIHTYSPWQMFSTAQQAGMQSTLDQRARTEAIKARAKNLDHSVKSFINFLPSSVYNPKFCLQHTFDIVEQYNVDPASLVFEVVETEKITNVEHLKSVLDEYKEHGMKVALDDVGSGYATLDMLHKLQPNYVKIDRQYVQDCHVDKANQTFLKSVLEISSALNIKVLAEGIEKKEELEFCHSIGIDFAQGYYIGKPNPTPQVLRKHIV